ncbi:unnamed protein product [Caretta caretta]
MISLNEYQYVPIDLLLYLEQVIASSMLGVLLALMGVAFQTSDRSNFRDSCPKEGLGDERWIETGTLTPNPFGGTCAYTTGMMGSLYSTNEYLQIRR